ncbi:MAG: diacylglycerol kinase family lipid kinase [Gemmatimonadetes bacterium]|nr:diacylglycerol kinase family lipid kinase [Gemmatimonadota bacterium]
MAVLRRVLLVSNPASRRGARFHGHAIEAFRAVGAECDDVVTQAPGHGGEIAARLAGSYDAVFTLGGDGTATEVIGALTGLDVPVGILPGGTGNLLARYLGIPLDIDAAVRTLVGGRRIRMDLGRLENGRAYAYSAGVGVDAEMVQRTPRLLKKVAGMPAYMIAATRAVLRARLFHVRATVDGVAVEREASAVYVANQPNVLGGHLTFGPDIRNDDGLLDLCVYTPRDPVDAARIMWRLFRADFRADPQLYFMKGREIRLETDPPQLAQADGELLGREPQLIRVESGAALLLAPMA